MKGLIRNIWGKLQPIAKNDYARIIAILILVISILLWEVIFKGYALGPYDNLFKDPVWANEYIEKNAQNPLLLDQDTQFLVWHQLVSEVLRTKNNFPLWNPYEFAGQPLVGNAQSALFYPPNLLLSILRAPQVASVRAIFNLFIAGFFTFLFCKSLKIKSGGAVIAALAFMLSGPIVVWLGHPHGNVLATLPLLMWTAEKTLQSRRFYPWGIITSLAIGLTLLGGHFQTSFQNLFISGLYIIIRLFQLPVGRQQKARVLMVFASASIFGVFIGSIATLPFLELLSKSSTLQSGRGEPKEHLLYHSAWLPYLSTIVTSIIPNFFGNPHSGNYWWPCRHATLNYNEQAIYIGLIPLSLAVFGVFSRDREKAVFLCASLAILCLCIAWRLPGFELINNLPIFNMISSGRLKFYFAFFGAVLAGIGFERLMENYRQDARIPPKTLFLTLVPSLLVIVILCTIFIFIHVYHLVNINHQFNHLSILNKIIDYNDKIFKFNEFKTLISFISALVFIGLLLLKVKKPHFASLVKKSMFLMIALELIVLAWNYNPAVPENLVYPPSAVTKYLSKEDAPYRVISRHMFAANYGTPYHIAQLQAYDLPVPKRIADLYRAWGGKGRDYFAQWDYHWPILNWLNVKYIITSDDIGSADLKLVYRRNAVKIYENIHCLPRAYMAYHYRYLKNDREKLNILTSTIFDYKNIVILGQPLPLYQEASLENYQFTDNQNHVEFIHYETDRAKIIVDTLHPGLLIMSDMLFPGWKARVDKAESPIYEANYAFRAVFIPAGKHTVEFYYQPISFMIGKWVTIMSLIVLLLLTISRPLYRRYIHH